VGDSLTDVVVVDVASVGIQGPVGPQGPQGNPGTGLPAAPTDGQVYGFQGSTSTWKAALPLTGGTLAGPLLLAADPAAALGTATKQYVDGTIGRAGGPFLPLTGGTMTGATTFNSGLTSLYSQALSGAMTPIPSARFGGSYSGTSTATGTYSTVWLTASADTLAAPALSICMLSVEPHLAAGWQGSRIGVRSYVATAGDTDLTSSVAANAGAVIGFSGGSFSNNNMGGVGAGYGTTQFGLGTQWGAVLQSTMQAGSTWWNSSIGVEIDNAILSGGNAIWNIGLLINLYPTSQVQGLTIDAAQVIAAGGTTKWINGILIGTGTGHSIDPNGYFIRGIGGGGGPRTAAGGVDMLQPNFNGTGTGGGGFAFRAPNFQVLNAGYAQVGPGLLSFNASGLIVDSPYQQVTAAAVAAGGTGFTVNDLLEGTDGTFASVTTVTAGAVTGVSILRSGWGLTGSLPINPVVFTAQGRNGATRGSGCTLNLTWTPASAISLNPSGGTTGVGGGINFGSVIATANTDLSKHIRLWSTTYGINVFTSQVGYVSPAGTVHKFIIGGADQLSISAGQVRFLNGTSNWITLNQFGIAPPAFVTRSVGTKVVLLEAVGASSADAAIGIDTNTIWMSGRTTSDFFRWYGGTTLAATLSGIGALSLVGSLGINGSTPPAKPTGWGTSTGGARAAITASSTTAQLAAGLAQLLNDLTAYGLIGV
jgi:hypothetical protein